MRRAMTLAIGLILVACRSQAKTYESVLVNMPVGNRTASIGDSLYSATSIDIADSMSAANLHGTVAAPGGEALRVVLFDWAAYKNWSDGYSFNPSWDSKWAASAIQLPQHGVSLPPSRYVLVVQKHSKSKPGSVTINLDLHVIYLAWREKPGITSKIAKWFK